MTDTLTPLPELTPEYQQRARQEVEDAKVLYQFTLIKEPFFDYGITVIWLIAAALLIWFGTMGGWGHMLFMVLSAGMMGIYLFYTMNPKVEQVVTLTEKGIIVSELEMVPEFFYAALRYSGYFTIGVSLVALLVIGPLAFAGAGAGALMAFKMTGVVKRPKIEVTPLNRNVVYFIEEVPNRFKHGVSCYFLESDMKPYELDEDTCSLQFCFYSATYEAPAHTQKAFIEAVNQLVKTEEIETVYP
ncbi:hypothetical protein [Vibrio ostreicida]|uniref:hypothetical protein n=1 Tax=Vibrio ostreicida TaxID=526588 RepID=UPI000970CB82|nr:hypothetical protein [Vibrio ostreicida]